MLEGGESIPNEWRITLTQFTSFLVKVGRSSSCPVCPHDGAWNFYIDQSLGLGLESFMMITQMHEVSPESLIRESETHPTYAMECPNCGYMVYTGVKKVVAALAEMEKKDG